MKKILIHIFLLICLFSFNVTIYAKCNDEELLNWANNVSIKLIDYKELYDKEGNKIYTGNLNYDYLLALDPSRKDVVIKATDLEKKNFTSEYVYGYRVTAIGCYINLEEMTYDIKIYGGEDSACPNELLRTIKYTVPPYNEYSKKEYCNENPDLAICQTYKDTSNVTQEEFYQEVIENSEPEIIEENKNDNKKILDIIEYLLFILVPIVIASIIFNVKLNKFKEKEGNK